MFSGTVCCSLGLLFSGKWRGLEVAIKTVIFSGVDQNTALVASEAAIASNLSHENVVSTYSHDIVDVQKAIGPEQGIYKFYLIQVHFHTSASLDTLVTLDIGPRQILNRYLQP